MEKQNYFKKRRFSPFGQYISYLETVDKNIKGTKEFGSMLILTLVEEVGELARAYLASHGRKPTNLAAQRDESYQRELGDIVVAILRLARIKNINLHKHVISSLRKIKRRQTQPKT